MSTRNEIIDGAQAPYKNKGLVYTEVLGWVDLGHAQGKDIRELLALIAQGEASGKEFYDVQYSQGMSGLLGQVRTGKVMIWRIRRGRPYWE